MSTETPEPLSTLDIRVYYEDTDTAGVVFYANYLKFFERARTEWLRRLGVNQSELARRDHRMFVVKGADIQYRKPARLDDLVTVRSQIVRLGRASGRIQGAGLRHSGRVGRQAVQAAPQRAAAARAGGALLLPQGLHQGMHARSARQQ